MTPALPVTIIGGYLGSGKTTLVNHLLRQANGLRLAVLVNDFGELPIDADLIEAQDGDVISLSGGCICCSYGDDLSLSLQKLQAQQVQPQHILIEASGVALPASIGNTLSLHRAYKLEGIVVLADATSIVQQASEKYIGDTVLRQLNDADLILINKLDLASAKTVVATRLWLGDVCPQATLVDSVQSKVDPIVIFELGDEFAWDERSATKNLATVVGSHKVTGINEQTLAEQPSHATSLFSSMHVFQEAALDANVLAAKLAEKNTALVRAKGFVRDKDNSIKTMQVVSRRWSISPAPASLPDATQLGFVCIAKAGELSEPLINALLDQATLSD